MLNTYRVEILAKMVRFCEKPRAKSQIDENWNMNRVHTDSYLSILSSRKLLEETEGRFISTELGRKFLSSHERLNRIVTNG